MLISCVTTAQFRRDTCSIFADSLRICNEIFKLAILAVGALKETIDRGRGGRWDAEDFGATVLGGMMPRIQLVYRF